MYHFILTILALVIQIYSIYLAKNNTESNLRYSFWYNIISVIIGLLSFYYYLTSLFTISNIYKVPT